MINVIRATEIILYVKSQSASREFYRQALAMEPDLDVPGMTSFPIGPGLKLGLMPESGIVKILSSAVPDPATGSGIPRCELYLMVDEPEAWLKRALSAGATPISPVQARDWGHIAGYCADTDGHVIVFARETGEGSL